MFRGLRPSSAARTAASAAVLPGSNPLTDPAVPRSAADPDDQPGPEAEAFWEAEYRQYLAGRALAVMRTEFQPTTWMACWECVVHDRPAAEVAAELGLSVGAVRAAKFRVLTRLRQELDGLLD